MKILTGFAVIEDRNGQRVTYTFDEVDERGNITKSNVKQSYLALEPSTKEAIAGLKTLVEARMNEEE
ncbi:hypothetical protein D3C73_1283580 [compost metagenome]